MVPGSGIFEASRNLRGTHQELMCAGGHYEEMVRRQTEAHGELVEPA